METSNTMTQEEAEKMTPEELRAMQDKLQRSQEEFNKRNTINGMAVHFYSAVLNGKCSSQAPLTEEQMKSDYVDAREMAEWVFNNNQAYLDEGAKLFEEVQ